MADSVKVRVTVGAALIVAVVTLFSLDHATGHGWGVILLCAALVAAGSAEYGRMNQAVGPIPTGPLVAAGVVYILLKGAAYELDPRLHALVGPFAIACAYGHMFACLRGSPSIERLRGLMATAAGFLYLPVLGGFALDARFALPGVGAAAFFYVVAIAKGTDICAYFTGKALGRTKVVPSVSPGKTAAGFVGAVVGGILITLAFCRWSALGEALPLALAPAAGMVMALVGISGDLIESFMKRAVATKDSASLLPGFGGVLDVVDSVVICAPAVYYMLVALDRTRPLA